MEAASNQTQLIEPVEASEKQPVDGFSAARCSAHPAGSMLNPLAFSELANGSDEIWIEGGGQLYRLRQTRQNKLILTK